MWAYGVPFQALSHDVWLICLSCIIGAFGEGLYFWVFPLYIRELHADYLQLGLVYSVLLGVSALVGIAGGVLADRNDRKKLLLLGWALWIFAPLIYSFATVWTWLIPGAVCWGASNVSSPALAAYVITAVTDKTKIASVVTFVFSTFTFSYIFAPAVGSYLGTIIGMKTVLLISTSLLVVSTCVLLFIRNQRPKRDNTSNTSSAMQNRKKPLFTLLLWTSFFASVTFFFTLARNFIPVFLSEQANLSEFYVGLFGSVNYAGMTFVGIAMGRLGDRWRKSGAIAVCLFLFAVSLIPILIVRDQTVLVLLAFGYGGSAVTGSLVSSHIGTIAPESRRGLWISIPQSLGLFAGFAAPYLGGFLYTYSPIYTFVAAVIPMPFLFAFALLVLRD